MRSNSSVSVKMKCAFNLYSLSIEHVRVNFYLLNFDTLSKLDLSILSVLAMYVLNMLKYLRKC